MGDVECWEAVHLMSDLHGAIARRELDALLAAIWRLDPAGVVGVAEAADEYDGLAQLGADALRRGGVDEAARAVARELRLGWGYDVDERRDVEWLGWFAQQIRSALER